MDYAALAIEAHRENRLADAVKYYRLLIEQQPASAQAWLAYGMLLQHRIRDFQGALGCYRRSIELQPTNPQASLYLGTLLYMLDHLDDAIPHLKSAIAGNQISAYPELACIYVRKGQIAKAQDTAAQFLSFNRNNSFAYYFAAWVAASRGNLNEALYYVTDAVSLDPAYPIPLGMRGMILSQLGRLEESKRVLQEMVFLQAQCIVQGSEKDRLDRSNQLWREFRHDAKRKLGVPPNVPANFLMLTGGLGDQFFSASLLADFKAANRNTPLVVVSGPNAKWETLYRGSADLFMHMDTDQIWLHPISNRFFPDHPYTPFFPWFGALQTVFSSRQISKYYLGLPQQVQGEPPRIPELIQQESIELFHRLGGKPGQSVLVSNLSNSNPMTTNTWWVALVDELTRRGFVVFQNMTNMMKPNPSDRLSSAIPVELPLEQIIPFVETAGYFIGIRSGLCDILGYANARMKAIHVKQPYPRNDRYPLSVWIDYQSGSSLRSAWENEFWQDIELMPNAEFNPDVISDWLVDSTA